MATTNTRTAIRITGSAGTQWVRAREAWGNSDRVQTTIGPRSGRKTFASERSAQQWIARFGSSILPAVWGHLTLSEAADQGLLEVVTL